MAHPLTKKEKNKQRKKIKELINPINTLNKIEKMKDFFLGIDKVLMIIVGLIEKIKNIFSFKSEIRSNFFL